MTIAKDCTIVGIGASAGGLEALEQFFTHVPENCGLAFVVIQHLDPTHVGMMPELLQRQTPMKVYQATDRLRVKPDSVYVIPPNKSLSLLNGTLHLFDPVEIRGLRLPVDIFFRSLAEDKQDNSVGIILSGMGSDGSLGLKAIKEKNGLVLVQDPQTAKFDGMPRCATEAVIADVIAPAAELPAKLMAILKVPRLSPKEAAVDDKTKSSLEKIIIILRDHTGHDFSHYKKNTLVRRIERRKSVHQLDKIQHYVRYLLENPQESEILFRELLIGVTSFFRESALWEKLREDLLPGLILEAPAGYQFRAWIPACSTGEEAYTLAITFKEAMASQSVHKNLSLQIFATDLDQDAIEKARKGFYPKNIVSDVSSERISRFFTPDPEGFRVNSEIREMVVFAPQNVIKDPPFTRLDILSCRNLLIYLESDLQKRLTALFRYSLNPGGILILGIAETLGSPCEGFSDLDVRLKVFRRTGVILSTDLLDFHTPGYSARTLPNEKKNAMKPVEKIQSLAEQILLQRFVPASVLVNSAGDILFITGRTGKYLEPPAGKANWNIFAMAREGLRQVLPGAFRKCIQNFEPVTIRNIRIGTDAGSQLVDVTIQRIDNPEGLRGMVMLIFTDVAGEPEPPDSAVKGGKALSTARSKELESELQRSYEELQSTREEMQTSQEELKSTNEELQSTNEELQSTNEELTTSKEEMQSLNEELQTVNIELQTKVTDYARASDDMKNLLNSIEIATLFLDKDLNVRRFTDQITKLFKLRNSDVGRPFTDLVTDLRYPEIGRHAEKVLKSLVPIETAIDAAEDRCFKVRIMPYRTVDDRIDGLVLTFADISESKRLELELKDLIARQQKGHEK